MISSRFGVCVTPSNPNQHVYLHSSTLTVYPIISVAFRCGVGQNTNGLARLGFANCE